MLNMDSKKQKTKNKTKNIRDFRKRVEFVQKEEVKLYKQYKIAKNFIIYFPKKAKVPFSAKIATWFLRKRGGIIDARYFDLRQK